MDFRAWALLSALFAGLTAILAKKGVEGVPPNLALAVRVAFVLVFAVALAWGTKDLEVTTLKGTTWLFLGLSALATFLSWACYFRALQGGPVSVVAPIDKLSFVMAVVLGLLVLHEPITPKVLAGSAIIVVGVLLTLA
ncbi:MAG: EamA family transporter [Fimbriimonadaceae bacterium]|nr:EamA family transporter [Fimbriimonadaceae bacterium]QYK55077.1 MAG: EamA family transporter [Fimbriimonadaceae bacterium]